MNAEQKQALQLAINKLFGDNVELTPVEKRLVERATGREPYDWPPDGFHKMAPQIIRDAIAREGFFAQ